MHVCAARAELRPLRPRPALTGCFPVPLQLRRCSPAPTWGLPSSCGSRRQRPSGRLCTQPSCRSCAACCRCQGGVAGNRGWPARTRGDQGRGPARCCLPLCTRALQRGCPVHVLDRPAGPRPPPPLFPRLKPPNPQAPSSPPVLLPLPQENGIELPRDRFDDSHAELMRFGKACGLLEASAPAWLVLRRVQNQLVPAV